MYITNIMLFEAALQYIIRDYYYRPPSVYRNSIQSEFIHVLETIQSQINKDTRFLLIYYYKPKITCEKSRKLTF